MRYSVCKKKLSTNYYTERQKIQEKNKFLNKK